MHIVVFLPTLTFELAVSFFHLSRFCYAPWLTQILPLPFVLKKKLRVMTQYGSISKLAGQKMMSVFLNA